MSREKFASVADYMASLPKETQVALEKMREIVRQVIPDAEEVMSYGVPTFKVNGKYVIYIAGFAKHVGMYPIFEDIEQDLPEAKNYHSGQSTVRFPLNQPIPYDLVEKITKYNLAKSIARTSKR